MYVKGIGLVKVFWCWLFWKLERNLLRYGFCLVLFVLGEIVGKSFGMYVFVDVGVWYGICYYCIMIVCLGKCLLLFWCSVVVKEVVGAGVWSLVWYGGIKFFKCLFKLGEMY